MPRGNRTFRVFVSSTFTDMRAERRILQRQVFPRLKTLCESRSASFQNVDLRWPTMIALPIEVNHGQVDLYAVDLYAVDLYAVDLYAVDLYTVYEYAEGYFMIDMEVIG